MAKVLLPYSKQFEISNVYHNFVESINAHHLSGEFSQGYARYQHEQQDYFLFFLQAKVYAAGKFVQDSPTACSIDEFFHNMLYTKQVTLFSTDLPLFLCTAVLFRKAPAAQIPMKLIDSEQLLRNIKGSGNDAVLVIRNGHSRSMVFCREGEPTVLYPAPKEHFSEDGSIDEKIIEYLYTDQNLDSVILDLYTEIQLPPSADAGESCQHYVDNLQEPAQADKGGHNILVRLGQRPVFLFPVHKSTITIGRGSDNDLVLNNLSVSRLHAKASIKGDTLIFEDCDSENGLLHKNRQQKKVGLKENDCLELGKYTICYVHDNGELNIPSFTDVNMSVSGNALEETMVMEQKPASAYVEHHGQNYPIQGSIFLIGKSQHAHIRITGLTVATVHARITGNMDTGFILAHVGGLKKVYLSGHAIKSATVKDGDVFSIGKERFVFRVIDEA